MVCHVGIGSRVSVYLAHVSIGAAVHGIVASDAVVGADEVVAGAALRNVTVVPAYYQVVARPARLPEVELSIRSGARGRGKLYLSDQHTPTGVLEKMLYP